MSKRATLSVPSLVAFLGMALCLQAAPTIRAIRINNRGRGTIERSFVLAHTRSREGEEFERPMVSQDVRALLDTGQFTHVHAGVEPAGDSVDLVYTLEKKLRLAEPIEVEGTQRLSPRKVRKLLGVEVGDLIDEQTLRAREVAVAADYREDLFNSVRFTWSIRELGDADGSARVSVTVDEGPRAFVRDVRFSGNRNVPTDQLRRLTRFKSRWNPFKWFKKRAYEDDQFEAYRLMIRDTYLSLGHLDVAVGDWVTTTGEDGSLTVTYPIAEGIQYRLGRLSVAGVSLFPESLILEATGVQSNQTASTDALRSSAQNIRDYYGSRGYISTRVKPTLVAETARGVLHVSFGITEGRLTHVRNVVVRGNTRTRDKVVRREFLIYPGDVFDEVKVRRSERRAQNLGFFSTVRSQTKDTRFPDQKDLVFDVEEKRTGQFMVGAGFSSVDQLTGFMELSQGNFDIRGWPHFTGGGQKLKLSTQFGSRRENYQISFVEPWFLDRRLSFGVDLYRSSVNYSEYDVERTGGAITLGKSLPYASRIDFQYRLEDVSIKDIADTNLYVFADDPDQEYSFVNEVDQMSSSLRATITQDTRDSPFFPHRGSRLRLFGEVTGGPLGFDSDLYRSGFRTSHYTSPWLDHVLSLRTRYETVEEYGDTDEVPITERLFAGGGRTIRGFDYRDVGPKVIPVDADEDNTYYRPVGGRSLASATVEYTIPIVSGIRFAGFYDIGNVWWDAYEFETSGLASGAGIGIRLDVPGFPIRVDRAWIVDRDSELTDEDPWVVWIGYDN